MLELIQQKISSIEAANIRMNDTVDQTLSSIVNDCKQSVSALIPEIGETNACNYASSRNVFWGLLSLVGAIGWIAADTLWSKILLGGGGIGLILNYILCKYKKSSESSYKEESSLSFSISTQKKKASQKVLSVIEEISNLWENLTKSNKEEVLTFIESSKLSANDKFNASSFVTVTKTLNFGLLKILNLIDDSKSFAELEENISQIGIMLKNEINDVAKLQIDSYRQVGKMMENA